MKTLAPFQVAALPRIVFGAGAVNSLAERCLDIGRRVLLITGARSFRSTPHWPRVCAGLSKGETLFDVSVADEPSPQMVDELVSRFRTQRIELVVGIGGGSVLDAAKAVAGLLPFGNSVLDHLEGVGRGIPYAGPALPFIAVPTTAGTGSEATKNAVLSERGPRGYKKSFRHDTLVPRVALVDPDLLKTCPPEQIAANGMDALTQLLESYLSTRASPFTDALAWSGLQQLNGGFETAWRGGDTPAAAAGRAAMAYSALLSGITLAQAGLGSVHGLASPLGAQFPIPHGIACGTLVAAATRKNVAALRQRDPETVSLQKYAEVGRLFAGDPTLGDGEAQDALVAALLHWTRLMGLPSLARFGVGHGDVSAIVAGSRGNSMQTNPVVLTDDEIAELVGECIS